MKVTMATTLLFVLLACNLATQADAHRFRGWRSVKHELEHVEELLAAKLDNQADKIDGLLSLLTQTRGEVGEAKECCCKKTCPDGWAEFQESCYKFEFTERTWYDAQGECHLQGGYLAEVASDAENTFIHNLEPVTAVWIGGALVEDVWYWDNSNETISGYFNWADGKPDGGNSENCLEIRYLDGHPRWNDYVCNHTVSYICEKPKE